MKRHVPSVTTQNPLVLGLNPASDLPQSPTSVAGSRSRVEALLLRAALDGEGPAFGSLVKPYLGLLYGIAHRACGDSALAEDAVQESLEIAYGRLARLRPESSLKSFLAGIVSRRARTLLRGEQRRAARELRGRAPERVPRADEDLEARRLAGRLRAALAKLPGKRQAALLMRLEGGLSDDEIAEALSSTRESVRVLVHLGLKALREALANEEVG
jgi:RNA polymerase sigma-70 factor (ECF subfamily)